MTLSRRLLVGSLVIVSVLVLLVVAIANRRLYAGLQRETADELGREARLVGMLWSQAPDPDALADSVGLVLGHRVTLIAPDGHVVGDADFDGQALAQLENHSTRPEVMAAKDSGIGTARRTSPSAGDEELYVAVPAANGIARVSIPTATLDSLFDSARRDVAMAGGLALLVSAVMIAFFSRAVSRPIVQLSEVARALAGGDLSRRPGLTAPGEVGMLALSLHSLAEQLEGRLGALQAEDALLTALVDSLHEGVLAVDAHRTVVRINAAGRALLDVDRDPPFPAEFLPRDRSLREALAAALAGRETESSEVELDQRTLALTARPLEGGGAVLALFDLTALRRLEIVRRDFVANVSHELRTPLTIVGGFAETLASDDLPAETRREFAEKIRGSTARMQRIVDDLLDLARIESGRWTPVVALVPIREMAMEIAATVREGAIAKGIAIDVNVPAGASTASADPTAVRQVLANLVENAVRHTTQGSVTIFSRPGNGGTWVGVRDTGPGIAPEHLPRIFERFYRVDPGRGRAHGGTGLGLAIVRHLVEAHGGRVHADSTQGHGTTIEAFFPARDIEVAAGA